MASHADAALVHRFGLVGQPPTFSNVPAVVQRRGQLTERQQPELHASGASTPSTDLSRSSATPYRTRCCRSGRTRSPAVRADAHNTTSTATFTITVVDTTPPVLTVPATITVSTTGSSRPGFDSGDRDLPWLGGGPRHRRSGADGHERRSCDVPCRHDRRELHGEGCVGKHDDQGLSRRRRPAATEYASASAPARRRPDASRRRQRREGHGRRRAGHADLVGSVGRRLRPRRDRSQRRQRRLADDGVHGQRLDVLRLVGEERDGVSVRDHRV